MANDSATGGFAFSLAKHTYLAENASGYFLVSEIPVRILRLNKSLFGLLKQLQSESEFSKLVQPYPDINQGQLLQTLLSLTSKGYLKLDRVAGLEDFPQVSVIIPVRDQPVDIVECLQSLANLDYPQDRLEIVVVDDGSASRISEVVAAFNVTVIRLEKSQGAAACRNMGVEKAHGDVLAFIDADCVADKNWLREIVPFFETEGMGAVGGFVDSYYKKLNLDRYEQVSSSLNLGGRLIFQNDRESNFYVPSCNMLVSRQAFLAVGGFKGGMRVGEDVDFCWRMRDQGGYTLLYVPLGRIAHKHRNQLLKMLRRRNDYGTSEGVLYQSHRDKRKRFPVPAAAGLSFLALLLSTLLISPYPLVFIPLFFGLDLYQKMATLQRFSLAHPFGRIFSSALRSHLSFFYFSSFHLVRYYLILLVILGFLFHPFWLFGGVVLLLASIVDYLVKKPRLSYPVFLSFYFLEHLAYQTGVFWGCLKVRSFRAYTLAFGKV